MKLITIIVAGMLLTLSIAAFAQADATSVDDSTTTTVEPTETTYEPDAGDTSSTTYDSTEEVSTEEDF